MAASKFSLRVRASLLLIGLLLIVARAQAQPPRYAIQDLGAFTPAALNDAGQVVGTRGNAAVLYSGGQLKDITPPGAVIAAPKAINNGGQVVGSAFTCDLVDGNCVNGRTRAFIYRGGAFELLGTFGGRDSFGFDINDAGLAVGYAYTPGPTPDISGGQHAFIYRDGTLEDIGARMGTGDTSAAAINEAGDVIGYSTIRTLRGLFLYRNGAATIFSTRGFAYDINDAGQVVGGGLGGNDDGSGHAFVYRNGSLQELGTLGSQYTFSVAYAINNRGQIVGQSSFSFFTNENQRAVIFEGSAPTDLNTLIAPGSGWLVTSAVGINEAGQIVGTGQLNGQPRAFLLTPTGQPALLIEPGTAHAVALDSVTHMRAPFPVVTARNFSADRRTRVALFVTNIALAPGETAQALTVQAEDAQHRTFFLPVEFVGPVPRFADLTQIVVRLPDELAAGGEVQLTVTLHGLTSGRATLSLRPPAAP